MKKLNIKEFTMTPGGRYRENGDYSGQEYRDNVLVKVLKNSEEEVIINLDGTLGYPVSFLEETFGGLIRESGYDMQTLNMRLKFISEEEPNLVEEINGYMADAALRKSA